VGAFTKHHPEVSIALKIGDTGEIINNILAGAIEFGIVGAQAGEKELSQEPLVEDDMCLVIPTDHRWADRQRVNLEMLRAEPFIVRERGSGTLKSLQLNLARQGASMDDFKIVAEMGSTEAVIQGIKSGLGVSILSRIAVSESLQGGTVQALAIDGLDLKRSFYLTRHKDRSPSPLGRTFITFLEENLTIP
jgi:DNA-binding transcriptional LysR family regulator